MTSFIVSKIDFICCLNKKVLRNFGQLIVQTRQTSKRHLIDKYIQILNILEIRLYEVVTFAFKHFHSAFFPLKPWLFATVVFVAHFRNTHSFVLEMWKWNERRGCLVRLVIFSSYRALFCSPGSLGESLIFFILILGASCCLLWNCNSIKAAELLSGSVPASPWKRKWERGRQGGHWPQGLSPTLSIFRGITSLDCRIAAGRSNNDIPSCGSVCGPVHTYTPTLTTGSSESPPRLYFPDTTVWLRELMWASTNRLWFPGNTPTAAIHAVLL